MASKKYDLTQRTLWKKIQEKRSYLCVGLDPDLKKIHPTIAKKKYPLFEFNKHIIDATYDLCVAYKLNTAFYEAHGTKGWEEMELTLDYIGKQHFIIADAKRGDIGNTSNLYCHAFFDRLPVDCITINPYMGRDTVSPFLSKQKKWTALLILTSNNGSLDFQCLPLQNGKLLFEEVLHQSLQWEGSEKLMFVVGGTHEEHFKKIRKMAPSHFFLVPGIGAQKGDLKSISKIALTQQCGLLVNVSRSILYASSQKNFAQASRQQATLIAHEMKDLLNLYSSL